MSYLIVGLGNIGEEYHQTRHNIGFEVVDALVKKYEGAFRTERYGSIATIRIKGKTLVCLLPSTYMNLSGKAVKYWMDKEKIRLSDILVVVDDLALPLCKLRLRSGGSHAGHNGLKSMEAELSTAQYPRLRFGIGNDFPKGKQVDFVLGKWKSKEWNVIQQTLPHSIHAIEQFVLAGIEQAMNFVNKQPD
ncbi:MAG: aminoacyl-tRNA hydrolase [Bacteroidetes bacterium]|nr:aminoacyl-tRNA hydrolase [Bacteroidota bacterium]